MGGSSDRKMSNEDYIRVRPTYLRKERKFRRNIGIILRKPLDYDENCVEIWNDDEIEEIWDAEREFNLDEVPFAFDMDAKQIIAIGERASVLKKNIKFIGKYRQGTLVIISNYKVILLVIIIFKKGGTGVAKKLKKLMSGSSRVRVVLDCSESGNMTGRIWKKTMNLIKNMTKVLRGCYNGNSLDWKKAIVLNFDNYIIHLERELADEYAKLYGIFGRCLIRNASHIQQPIDQHIGIFLKNRIKQNLETWMCNNNRFNSFGQLLDIDTQKWREITARFVLDAVQSIESMQNSHVLTLAWVNYGLFLKLDGSQDGDIETLHKDSITRDASWRQERTANLIDKVTIRKRIGGTVNRVYMPLHANYSMHDADANSRVVTHIQAHNLNHLQYDLSQKNQTSLDGFAMDFDKDLTNLSNKLPDLSRLISPYDVLTLKSIYKIHGDEKQLESFFLKELKIPTRDNQGRIITFPSKGIYIYIYDLYTFFFKYTV